MQEGMERSGIYEIVNRANGKRYVGSAVNLRIRRGQHLNALRKGFHANGHMRAAAKKYGADQFGYKPLLYCDRSELIFFEQRVIDALDPEYNIARTAGNTLGVKLSQERKDKIAAMARGRKRSAESIERGAVKRRGVKMSPEQCAKRLGNQHAKGHIHTDEWKAANSALHTGRARPKSPEYRAKIAATLRGRTMPADVRAKISASLTGKKRAPYNYKQKVVE